ncbi:MAG: ROK family protein, partial [Deltaproteobacteria bacterium]|nr:ROK family protein [Deltaproteobacteria bacterium]
MPPSQYAISVDLGGTNLRVAAVSQDGTIEERERYDSDARLGSRVVLERVAFGIKEVAGRIEAKKGQIIGVGLGFPGIVDPQRGMVHQSPHFPDWKDLDLLGFFQKELSWPVVIDNDANMAALGEMTMGAGKGLKNFVMLTFGTGIGGGIVIHEKIFHGDRGFAGELGHICIEAEGPPCPCGSRGCWESYVSAKGILRLVEESQDVEGRDILLARFGGLLEKLTVQRLYEAALDGDIFANVTFKKMGYFLGIGIASLVNTLGIDAFILGGGVAQAWDFFIEPARKELTERTYHETARGVTLQKAALGENAALV